MTTKMHPVGNSRDQLITALRHITVEQLLHLGTRQVVYLKTGMLNGELAFVVHGADGVPLAAVDDIAAAMEMAAGNGLCFAAVH